MSLGNRLYTGQTAIDFVGRRRLWFTLSGIAMLVSLVALIVPGLNFGIDFRGGAVFEARATRPVSEGQLRQLIGPTAKVIQVTDERPPRVRVQTEELPEDQVARVRQQLSQATGAEKVDTRAIGSKWGSTVSRRALLALVAFVVVVTLFVSVRLEFKMAVVALVALAHDLLLTAGIYALARFEVSPATVIALLTILGYSLYDTVVVFDKVKENTSGLGSMSRATYSDLANQAVNQTAVRSLNTSLASLLPVGALLFVGSALLGAETLKDLSLALFVGVATGTYSSMFLAVPMLAAWKEREPRNQQIRARIARLGAAGATGAAGRGARAGAAAERAAAARERPAAAGGSQRRRAGARPAAQPVEEELMPMPQLPPDPEDGDGELPGEPAAAVEREPEPAGSSTPRPARQQRARPPQRRKSGARAASRPAKRRRR
ncbi:MAG TPA: protein translocase subunit SecF [Actinomycetes bacterium]|nr:protein translocase subunit SecF [Actinomycetes bacterium]